MKKHELHVQHLSAAAHLAFRFSLLITVIIFVVSFSVVLMLRSNIRGQQNREIIVAADRIAASFSGTPEHPFQNTDEVLLNDGLPYYILFTVYRGDSNTVLETNDPFLPRLLLTGGRAVRYRSKNYFIDGDLNILYCAKRYITANSGIITVEAAQNMDRDTSEQLLLGLPRLMLIMLVPLLFVSFWASLLITRRTLKPVEEMTESAQKISSANLDSRLPVTGCGDELDTLAATFNDLFSRLKTDFDCERQFTSNVSHELKTPLSVILGQANLLRRWGKNDPVQLEKSINVLLTESRSMEAIITNLLQLSRLENGIVTLAMESLPVKPLLLRLAEDTYNWSPETRFSFDTVSDAVAVNADKEFLYEAFTIVVANSIKFTPPPADITVIVRQADGLVSISFVDNGPGFVPETLPYVFERFYRGDPSHNRNAGGSGLGLAIAKVIMNVMHGSVTAGNAAGHGALLTFVLPAA